ncbi:hypothetical protein B0181_01725 [Moraxella caviae]|uniref:Esterase EstA n=1 Tax=Moraxella caviae TaxID=34060 RepID=A0A1T0A9C3_9GAMM|nr:autotransporter domain-containing protein [Moraxella caviae]OOR92337.1 hypothetical protein B0181_01725 [Moraxella caviae]STZ10601.1 Esterase EstA precursor [Moraxella caviae]
MKFSPSVLALSLAIASTPAFAADFSQTVFFGDSLTDSGTFKESLIVKMLGGGSEAKFTTNPDEVWAQHLAKSYSSNADSTALSDAGNNYAAGGARVNTAVNNYGLNAPSVHAQIDKHISERGVDSNALYSVWIGANDLLAATESDTASAQRTVLQAANDTAAAVKTLHEHGAKYIVVPNLPDMGLTPRAIAGGTQAQATTAANTFNNLVAAQLKSSGANVIALDTFSLLQEVAANPSEYGFSHTTRTACSVVNSLLCTPNTLVESNANQTYLFADDIHPSGATHKALADYARSVIEAPTQIAAARALTHHAAFARQDDVLRHTDLLDKPKHDEKRANVWLLGAAHQHETLGTASLESDKHTAPNALIGVDVSNLLSQNSTTGFYANHSKIKPDWGNKGQFESKSTGFGVYHNQHYGNDSTLTLVLGADRLHTDSTRHANIGKAVHTHEAEGRGTQLNASAKYAKHYQFGRSTVSPYVGLNAVRTSLTSLSENGKASSAMHFERQEFSDVNASLGVRGKFAINDSANAFAEAGYTHQLTDDDDTTISARIAGLTNANSFSLPVSSPDTSGARFALGVQGNFAKINAAAGVNYRTGDDKGAGAFVQLGTAF